MIDVDKIKAEKGEKCWDKLGVFGEGTCNLLDEFYHCKNCPVYASGGRYLLEREIAPEMISEWSRLISLPKEIESGDKVSLVIFRIGEEWLGINTNIFQEAAVSKYVHFVPSRTNDYFIGIINVNGELLRCISLAKFLNLPPVMLDSENIKTKVFKNLLVIFDEFSRIAFPVDEYLGVASLSQSIMSEPPQTVVKHEHSVSRQIFSFKNRNVALIDEKKLFNSINRKIAW